MNVIGEMFWVYYLKLFTIVYRNFGPFCDHCGGMLGDIVHLEDHGMGFPCQGKPQRLKIMSVCLCANIWLGELLYAFQPFPLILPTLHRVNLSTQRVLMLPEWPMSVCFPMLLHLLDREP
ncbi:hypothetical protein ATANTOWER_008324 [Ataeniobius toweri]|uniref:Uncharacterized protein n=1 Tax=Ataeniobius toweri TaxID=208326 RepID=A0ABU7CAA7_9TELE|nr:hypothetical protein [Ataeniobius toweri]